MLTEKIGVIGAGKIGSAIARGVIRSGLAAKENVMASDVSDALRQAAVNQLGIKVTAENNALCDFADILILAVKPQIVDPVAREIAKRLGTSKLLVSVAAGVPLSRIEARFSAGCPRRAGDAEYSLRRRRRRGRLRRRQPCNRRGLGKSRRDTQQLRRRHGGGRKIFGRGHGIERQRTSLCFSFHGSTCRRRRASRSNARRGAQARRCKPSTAPHTWLSRATNISAN